MYLGCQSVQPWCHFFRQGELREPTDKAVYQIRQFRTAYFVYRCFNLSGWRWIRTTVGVSQQIYSLPHLATLVFAHAFDLWCKDTNYFSNFQA